MWKVISFFLLSSGLFGFSSVNAETIPAPTRTHSYWWLSGGVCVSDDAVSNNPVCQLKGGSAFCAYFGAGVARYFPPPDDAVQCDNGRIGSSVKDTYRGECPPGYTPELYGTQCYRPDQPKPDPEAACTGSQLANYCASISGKSVDVSKFADKIAGRSRMCDNVNTQAPGCLMVEGTGCRITSNFPLTGKFSYNGQACARLPNGDPDNTEGAPSPNQCAPGESFGTVNGVTGCFAGGPIQPSEKPPVDLSTGKDANGNCAAGYVGRIKNNQLECNPSHVPTDGATCPSGWNAVGVGGKTVCVDPTSGPGGSTGGSGGTGGTGGTPGGGGNNGGNTGGNTGGGKGDASSPGGEPGEGDKPGDKCNYTGMLSFLCDSAPPSFNPDKSGLSGDIGGDLGSMLDTRDFVFGTSSCPPDYFVDYSIGGAAGRLKLTYAPWCTIAQFVRPIVIAIAFVISGFIIFSGRIK
ncbi:virulence factor TspB C-terminal domain-related protein [Chromobacterium haemolyticum]|uniref:virulence factor TspB C-terminal domain-related protein n=1 Tax=Chromobacterium haemolyticum TaxID=394935 RepID=UPI0012F737BE|nr:virulence factor TspB C-terminal domain-related protein [Chromobacterium haemolyticum]